MSEFQASKQLVLDCYQALDAARSDDVRQVLKKFTAADYCWHGVHPFNKRRGSESVADAFWSPFKRAFAPIQRRQDIFFAGRCLSDEDETERVCSMGHLVGIFQHPWLGIQPTGKMSFLRYVEFNRIVNGKIVESTLFIDIMNFMRHVGLPLFPESTGVTVITPGPQTHDGLLFDQSPADEGGKTLGLITRMIDRLVSAGVSATRSELECDWVEDMLWWGPGGIGASYTIDGYLHGHCQPFESGLEFVHYNPDEVRFAEGHYGGLCGYPSLEMRSTGGYLGMLSASEQTAEMRIVDLYRRSGDKLAENWIFIDHLHFLKQYGIDLLARQRQLAGAVC